MRQPFINKELGIRRMETEELLMLIMHNFNWQFYRGKLTPHYRKLYTDYQLDMLRLILDSLLDAKYVAQDTYCFELLFYGYMPEDQSVWYCYPNILDFNQIRLFQHTWRKYREENANCPEWHEWKSATLDIDYDRVSERYHTEAEPFKL